jgi:hypothetical protein
MHQVNTGVPTDRAGRIGYCVGYVIGVACRAVLPARVMDFCLDVVARALRRYDSQAEPTAQPDARAIDLAFIEETRFAVGDIKALMVADTNRHFLVCRDD